MATKPTTGAWTREAAADWLATRVRTHTADELLADPAAVEAACATALVHHRSCGCQWTVLVERARAALVPAAVVAQMGWDL